jgi:hypothetical protein
LLRLCINGYGCWGWEALGIAMFNSVCKSIGSSINQASNNHTFSFRKTVKSIRFEHPDPLTI